MFKARGRGTSRNKGGRFGRGDRFFSRNRQRNISIKSSVGPAEDSIPKLTKHYFDCTSFNEADRYINTKEKIISYLGTKYGGDLRLTLEKQKKMRFLHLKIQWISSNWRM